MPGRLFCYIRKRWITATPEESVRQFLIQHMVEKLDYPLQTLILEKNLTQLPHLDPAGLSTIPHRRADLIVMAKDLHPNHPFYPLLLVECKAVPLNEKTMRQVLGYNHFLKAYFIAAANQKEIQLGWTDPKAETLHLSQGLPPFIDLFNFVKKHLIVLK